LGAASIITTVVVESGISREVPVIVGGSITGPITLPPVTTTLATAQATSSVASVSTEIALLIPMINDWKADPTGLKSGTIGKITGIRGDVDDLISNLGGKSSSSGCGSKKKRGLLSFFGKIVSTLTCIDKDPENIKDNIEGVSWYRSGVLSNIDQGFCPTLAMAFEAYEPHFVYKPRCPLHPLELSVFVLSIQSIRLVDFLTR
jgi:hypothetical protein